MTRSDAAYKALYTPLRTDYYSFTSSWSGTLAAHAPKAFASETTLWLNGVSTDRTGYLKVRLGNLRAARLYLIHVIALGADTAIG